MPSARRNRDNKNNNKNNNNNSKKLTKKTRGGGHTNGSKKTTTETKSNVAGNNTIGGGFNIEKTKTKMKENDSENDDDDSDDAYDDLPNDFTDEEIDEDEAFAEEDKETYRGMRFYDEKRKEEEEEEDDDDGYGELIARAMQTNKTKTSKNSQSEDGDNAAAPVKRSAIVPPSVTAVAKKRKVRGVNDALDEEERVDLDSEDDEETRALDDDEKDDKRKKMLDDILGENRRERRLEQPKPGSVTEYEKEGEYNAPVDLNGETLTLEDAIAALTRAKRSTGEIANLSLIHISEPTRPY